MWEFSFLSRNSGYWIHLFPRVQGINLKGSAIELLEVMLEETNKKTKELAMEIAGSLDVGALHDTLCDFRTLMQNRQVQEQHYDDNAENGMYRTYHCLAYLTRYGVPAESVGESHTPAPSYTVHLSTSFHRK